MKSSKLAVNFRPKARMVKIIGEQLIRDNTVGLLELIKNSFDADASTVKIQLNNLSNPKKTEIIIEDNGFGMNEGTIKGPWMEPAHEGKEEDKIHKRRTPKGRLCLGEKGVGRFATQRLGKTLELITKSKESNEEFYLKIEWENFEKSNKYMDEIQLVLIKRSPEVFKKGSGTRLVMRGSRDTWKKKDIERLHANLIKLVTPKKDMKDFRIILKCPEHPEFENLEQSDILDKYQFKIDCKIDKKGLAKFVYYERSPDGHVHKKSGKRNLWAQINPEDWVRRYPECGPFKITLTAWLLHVINGYDISKAHLKVLGGISIYREDFRILPYGDEQDDWLGLGPRRINSPGKKYANNQIIGIVEVDQINNPKLQDKTNREGLQENEAFYDLKLFSVGVLGILEEMSSEERSKVKPKVHKVKEELETKNVELRSQVEKLTDEIEKIKVGATPSDKSDKISVQETVTIPIKQIEQLQKEASKIEESRAEINDSIDYIIHDLSEIKENQKEAFIHLMGIGLAAERFAHEFEREVSMINSCADDLNAALPSEKNIQQKIHRLMLSVNALKNEVALMGVSRYIRRSQNRTDTSVNQIVKLVLDGHKREIEESDIKIESSKNDFKVLMSEASLSQVIDNIISNAIYWLQQKSEKTRRFIFITINPMERTILISNNGSRILPNIKTDLFKVPFTTAKYEGRGLGMFITSEILQRNNAYIELLDENNKDNKFRSAAFKITFHPQ